MQDVMMAIPLQQPYLDCVSQPGDDISVLCIEVGPQAIAAKKIAHLKLDYDQSFQSDQVSI